MKRSMLGIVVQVVAGVALVAAAAWLLMDWLASEQMAHIPAGRRILRPPQDVQCLAQVDESIWAGGRDGLFVFAVDGSAQPVPAPLRGLHFVSALLRESDGGVWVAHEDGMSYWKSGAVKHFSAQAGAFPGRGLSVLRDREGTLWAGSERTLARLEGDVFRPLVMPDSFASSEVDVLYQDHAGALWIGDSSPRSPGLIRRD